MNNPRLPVVPARRKYKRRGSSIYSVRRLYEDWKVNADAVRRYYAGSFSFDELKKIEQKEEFFESLLKRKAFKDRCKKGEWLLLKCTAHSPYEGCWYEPNFWFLSPDLVRIAPLYVSHSKWSAQERLEMLHEKTSFRDFVEQFITGEYQNWWDEWEVHIIKKDSVITEHLHPTFVPRICHNFGDLKAVDFNPPLFKCDNCGELSDEPHTHSGDYYGIGGLAQATDKLYCESCVCGGCASCDHPMKDGESFYVDEEMAKRYNVSEGDYCEWCIPETKCISCGKSVAVSKMQESLCNDCVNALVKRLSENPGLLERLEEIGTICALCGGLRPPDSSQHPERCQACVDKEMLPNKGA